MAAFLFFFPTTLTAKVSTRLELRAALEKFACNDTKYSTQDLWDIEVYDTQIHVMKFKPRIRLSQRQIEKTIIQKVGDLHHTGYVNGRCPDRSYWFASTPSGGSVKVNEGQIQLPKSIFVNHCQQIKATYSSAYGGRSRNLYSGDLKNVKNDLFLNTLLLTPGTISVTCIPYEKSIGDQLWFLFPVKYEMKKTFPYVEDLSSTSDITSFFNWINKIRTEHNLRTLSRINDEYLKIHTSKNHVNHDLKEFHSLKNIFKKNGYTLLGENRVIGVDFKTMTWMLWNSPTHRDLILSSNGDSIYLELKGLNTGMLSLTLLVGKH